MSYAVIPDPRRPLAPSRFGRGLKGLTVPMPLPPVPMRSSFPRWGIGTMLDANMFTSAWYLPLVEKINKQNGQRSYAWAQYKYLSNWDALDYNMSFTQYTPTSQQESTLYQWDGSQWRKTSVQSGI